MQNYQQRVPRARVNISLEDNQKESSQKTELPMRLLVMANHLGRADERPLMDRTRVNINADNFNAVMKSLKPTLNLELKNSEVKLDFQSLDDFKLQAIAQQVPELIELLEKREALRELKRTYKNNNQLRQWMRGQLQPGDKDA